ncbi:hypothetical protein [Kribbella sp. DT2]|uniref:hypothetical protein n=1 Tax=Kribbella sp. DT2 TaxID=3393427 RepID=UPI003CF72069
MTDHRPEERTPNLTDADFSDRPTDEQAVVDPEQPVAEDDATPAEAVAEEHAAPAEVVAEQPAVSTDGPLVAEDAAVDFRSRWEVIQQGFVDDPRQAVSDADKLVDDLLKRLSATFDEQHQGLERQWSDGEPSTEDLRGALQKYRAFFQRLLAL